MTMISSNNQRAVCYSNPNGYNIIYAYIHILTKKRAWADFLIGIVCNTQIVKIINDSGKYCSQIVDTTIQSMG